MDEEWREFSRRERRDNRAAGKAFASACASNDPDALYSAAAMMSMTVDGWASAMRSVSRLPAVGEDIPAAFLPIWIEKSAMLRTVGNRRALVSALRHLMPPKPPPEAMKLFRGAAAPERRSGAYGLSWTSSLEVAREFARSNGRLTGGVVISTVAAPEAVILVREVEGYYDEGEVVVDPYKLGRVQLVERVPPNEQAAGMLSSLLG